MNRELERRNAERGRGSLQWFTPEEAAAAEALAKIIVPSEEESPGIDEVCILGPSAIVSLDKLVATDPNRQRVYSRGLFAFDTWAMHEHGCKFADISTKDQTILFRRAQEIHDGWRTAASAIAKMWRRLKSALPSRTGSFFAAALYPMIRGDCLQIFYTSRVSWIWLDYDGPPMEEGYPNLMPRR